MIRKALKKDGCLLLSVYGGESLQELRSAFALSDMERFGGTWHIFCFTQA